MFSTRKTYDSITSGLSKMIEDLQNFATTQRDEAGQKEEQAIHLVAAAQEARHEASRADSTAKKLKDLLA